MFIQIKKWQVTIICILSMHCVFAQQQEPFNHPVCRTTVSDTGYYMRNAEAFLAAAKQNDPDNSAFTSPFNIRVFIRIVRQNDGTLPGCDMATAIQNFNEMNGQYNGHNICFQLVGIDFVNDTYLNNFNTVADLDVVYPNYIRNHNLDVDGAITIFIHYNFLNNSGSSGNAYGVPNNFMSVARWAATGTNVHSIFGHEMGHCLGLYHTFQKSKGVQESVTRNIFNMCYNCSNEGDLCCDTPADYANSQTNTSNTCVYSSSTTNACDGLQYSPSTINIMSYQPWSCISFTSTALTNDQRTRIHATLLNPLAPIFTRVAEDNIVLGTVSASSNEVRLYSAKNNVTTGSGVTVLQSGSSQAYYAAGNSVTIGPGVTFSPGSVGLANVSISSCN